MAKSILTNIPLEYILLKIKYFKYKSNNKKLKKIVKLLNTVEDMIGAYFKKV